MTDESLFREVDDDLRQEQYKKLWRRFGNYFIAVCVIVVASVAGYKVYQQYQQQQAQAASILYFDALRAIETSKLDEATQNLSLVKEGGYQQLARFQQAALLATQGKTPEAVSAFEAISADKAVETTLRDAAAIRAGYLLVDTLNLGALQAKLNQFDKPELPWRFAVREIFALAAYRDKDYRQVEKYLDANLTDPDTPPGIKERAGILLQVIAPDLQPAQ